MSLDYLTFAHDFETLNRDLLFSIIIIDQTGPIFIILVYSIRYLHMCNAYIQKFPFHSSEIKHFLQICLEV